MSELLLFALVTASWLFGVVVGFVTRGKWDQV